MNAPDYQNIFWGEIFSNGGLSEKLWWCVYSGSSGKRKRNEEGEVVDSWSETYANLLYSLINEFNDEEVAMSLEKIMAYCNFCVIIIL